MMDSTRQRHGTAAATVAAVLICAATCLQTAMAHGGELHRWTMNPNVTAAVPGAEIPSYTQPSLLAAVAKDWQMVNMTDVSPAFYTLPIFPTKLNLSVTGTVEFYTYLSGNCTDAPQTVITPFLHFHIHEKRKNKWTTKPFGMADKIAYGYAFSGPCDTPDNMYRNNSSLEDNHFNIAWWDAEGVIGEGMNLTDVKPGLLWGAAPLLWFIRGPNQAAEGEVLSSFILVVQGGPTFCANIEWLADPTAINSTGVTCTGPVDTSR